MTTNERGGADESIIGRLRFAASCRNPKLPWQLIFLLGEAADALEKTEHTRRAAIAEAMEKAIQKCRDVQKECEGFPSVNALDQALGAFRCVSALQESFSENQTKGKGE